MHIFGELVHIFGKLVHIFAWKLVSRTSKRVSRNLGPLWQPGVYNDTREVILLCFEVVFFASRGLFSGGGPSSVRFGYGLGVERFERFRFSVPAVPLAKRVSVLQHSFTGKDGSGSGFGSWKTVPAVPVPLSVSGKTVLTVPVSGSSLVPEPHCILKIASKDAQGAGRLYVSQKYSGQASLAPSFLAATATAAPDLRGRS